MTVQDKLKKDDYLSAVDPRWCPGCGDYSVLNMLTAAWAEVGAKKENLVVISGIGCSSRLPYYTDSYGFHTIHGRAPTVALGAKLANPELDIWIVTGDGDGLSIGSNHLIHLIRRNPNVKVLLFNNEIYGLTKGQASPTSQTGLRTKSTPLGAVDRPVKPLQLALTAGASFAARVVDAYAPHMKKVFVEAAQHRGLAFIEILTNCVIFNDQAFVDFERKDRRHDNVVELHHGEPLLFGKQKDKAVTLDKLQLGTADMVDVQGELIKHDRHASFGLADMLAAADYPDIPLPIGVFRQISRPCYEDLVQSQEAEARAAHGAADLKALLHSGETWQVD